jgi:hypothetical protein
MVAPAMARFQWVPARITPVRGSIGHVRGHFDLPHVCCARRGPERGDTQEEHEETVKPSRLAR